LVELQNRLLQLHKRRPSTFQRVVRNAVHTSADEHGTPLEKLIDMLVEIQRVDASLPANATLTKKDLAAIAKTVHDFLVDDGHGIERLYAVIQNRTISPPQEQVKP
jgi:hypothetical protein